jgi:hypothetical protein
MEQDNGPSQTGQAQYKKVPGTKYGEYEKYGNVLLIYQNNAVVLCKLIYPYLVLCTFFISKLG